MATNMIHKTADQLKITLTAQSYPTSTDNADSNDPVVLGGIVGVALADSDTTTKEVVIRRTGAFSLEVVAKRDSGENSEVVAGDALYINPTGGQIDKDHTKTHFGYALEDITSGETETIKVLLRD